MVAEHFVPYGGGGDVMERGDRDSIGIGIVLILLIWYYGMIICVWQFICGGGDLFVAGTGQTHFPARSEFVLSHF
jgi:hypothetical protein